MIVRYLDPLERLEYEIIQRQEEGSDVKGLHAKYQSLLTKPEEEARASAHKILADLMMEGPPPCLHSSFEPGQLDTSPPLNNTPPAVSGHKPHDSGLYDKTLGGWIGRAAGCLLGKPVERHMRPALREMLQSNDNWPLSNYWTQKGMAQPILDKYPWKRRLGQESLRENITCMPEDDDLNYTMLNLHIVETSGHNFDSNDIATAWVTNLPAFQVFTAERIAYFNILEGRSAPDTALYMNPFREWVGAQIRADLWGYVSPGNPEKAAHMAWRDARLSHANNGIFSEIFFAALIAHAFTEADIRVLVVSALGQIPEKSRFAQAIQFVLDLPIKTMEWEAVLDALDRQFGNYHWVHSINNGALTVAALLAGDGDYEKTICNAVMGGWDTDSNGATAGSIMGVILGAQSLPEKWTLPLNNRIRSSVSGFDNACFTDLARRTLEAANMHEDKKTSGQSGRSDDF